MKNNFRFVFSTLALVSVFASPVRAANWTIDPQHSAATFKIKHLAIATVRGTVTGIEGGILEKSEGNFSVKASLAASTLTTSNERRDTHLKSGDFFDVAKFPKMVFEGARAKSGKLQGTLTIHGVTRPIELVNPVLSTVVVGSEKESRRAFSATATLNRKDFGLTWNKSLDGGGLLIGDDVHVEIELELTGDATKT